MNALPCSTRMVEHGAVIGRLPLSWLQNGFLVEAQRRAVVPGVHVEKGLAQLSETRSREPLQT